MSMKLSQLSRALPPLLAVRRPVFIWGKPGIGKSDTIAQIAAADGRELKDVRLGLMDPVDVKGFPVPDIENNAMKWLPAEFLPPMFVPGTGKDKGKMVPNESKGLLFLDEMNSAPRATQAASYQLILNHRIGEYVLPKNWAVVAAGNNLEDRAVVVDMPTPLANRFVHIDIEIDADDWHSWALTSGVHDHVRAFLRFRPKLLHAFEPGKDKRAFPTPRSWSFVSDLCKASLDTPTLFELVRGTVGEGAANEFVPFFKTLDQLPDIDQILVAPKKAPLPENVSVKHAVVSALESRVTVTNADRVMDYMNRLPKEFQTIFIQSMANNNEKVYRTKPVMDWVIKNHEVVS